MEKIGLYIDLTKYPDLYNGLRVLAQKNTTSAASIVRQLVKKGLKESGIKVSDERIKSAKSDSKQV